ncbi:plasmid pRiA4b ORF-3 family protein [Romeria aff. gracilis LEGE 07310]|uniref:Plasmid pRiA4b ORF-3 family protein n=1 Tax=Vasconcelosia minhoensis LEGE 07310 TaxID=915328 RepID=A0A8J7AGT9_9CYAN|nr:plasmid pRiA4b ORF-3 family protein [Romeria gracilis]MBE9077293.1 plasmid pRiA4b ORF-3 family protein [Romeria aff. gracilis LEGE 07310]
MMTETYLLKVTLVDSDPPIWRQVIIPGQLSLAQLHPILQLAMGWQNLHDYRFQLGQGKRILPPETMLQDCPARFSYLYDFQAGWLHQVEFDPSLPDDSGPPLPFCLDGDMACPPENSGGLWGYLDLLERLNDTDDPDYVTLWDWVGSDFDPAKFDLDAANQRLADC